MDDATSQPRTCKVCGGPLRVNNTYDICSDPLKPECQQARERERRKRRLGDDAPDRHCRVCGARLRSDNTIDVCSGSNSTPECKRERKNLERAALGLPPYEPAEDVTEVRAGDTFGFWTVIEGGRGVVNYVPCRCACGTERNVTIARLTEGRSTSCGTECTARRAANPYLRAGEIYGRLTVLEPALRSRDLVLCRCECGNETEKRAGLVKNGHTTSCRCRMGKFTHGLSRHPLWGTWDGIRDRCNNPASIGYERYGSCGITLCAGWTGAPDGFLAFVADMGERPDGMTVDRQDPEGGYWCGHCAECISLGRPANCRWATKETQARNKRRVGKLVQQRNAALAQAEAALAEVERLNQLLARAPRKRPAPGSAGAHDSLF